jgi:hypothetical protein
MATENEVIDRAVLSWDPAFYHDRSGLILLQKKDLIRSFEFHEPAVKVRSWFEVRHIEVIKGDYLRQSDAVVARWMQFNRWYKERHVPLTLIIDVAGVGTSVRMTLKDRAEMSGVHIPVRPYSFVASISPTSSSHGVLRMDKPSVYELAYRLAANGQLKIDKNLPLAKELKIEMENLQVVQSPSGRPLINAASGSYDDLTTAVVAALGFCDLRGPAPRPVQNIEPQKDRCFYGPPFEWMNK